MSESVAIASAVFLVFLILFFNNITCTVGGAFMSIFSSVRAREYKDDPYFKRSSIISFLLALPLFAFCLINCRITGYSFIVTTLTLAVCAIVNHLSDILLSALDSDYKFAEEIRNSDNTFVLISVLSVPAVIYCLLVEPESNLLAEIWVAGVFLIFVIIRYFAVLRRLFSMKFSRFFTILYLCGLKILPIAVVVKVLVK